MLSEMVEAVRCPGCDADDFETIYPSAYPSDLTAGQVHEIYSASSSHRLFDAVVRCRKCSLVYLNPRFRQDLILESYADAVDPTFVKQNDLRIRTFRRSVDRLLARKAFAGNARVLDVGCAGGAFPKAAQDAGLQVTGVEPSRWLAEFGRTSYGVDVRTGFLADQAFEAESFDVVTLWDVIEHLPDPRNVLREIRRVLKADGTLIINFPDDASVARRLLGRNWPMFLSVHLIYFTPRTLAEFISREGFETIEVRPFWQTLELGYALHRAADYFRVFGWIEKLVTAIGIGRVPLTYNIGQSLMVARRTR
jgi:2-polyprenyl-3-methyl-5-hydroxy-6-metoxy-1,4-benzoquinol methylase